MKNKIENFLQEFSDTPSQIDGDFTVYTLNDTKGMGKGTMHVIELLDGIFLSYNDLVMSSCSNEHFPDFPYIGINHCKEGTYEVILPNEKACFMQKGDIAINYHKKTAAYDSRLPSKMYKGLTLMFDEEKAERSLKIMAPYLNFTLSSFITTTLKGKGVSLMHRNVNSEEILSVMYSDEAKRSKVFLISKMIELLIYLNENYVDNSADMLLFSPSVVARTREACSYLAQNLEKKVTSAFLAKHFRLAETSLRECFKAMYGMPVATYQRALKINRAEEILKTEQNCQIGELSQLLGYENQSKFASAFRSQTGISPIEYRNKHL